MDNKLKYHLTDRVPAHETILYAMQHMVYFAAGTVVLPIAVGIALGLNQVEMATFLQRTFILCGITTLIQLRWGHTYPIIDGPAGLWASIMIVMSSAAADMGSSAEKLCTDLEMGAIIAGVVVMIIAATGFINTLAKLFTPIVNGVVITLMVLQMSSTFLRGILGLTSENSKIDIKSVMVFLITIMVIFFIAIYMKGFLQSISALIGTAIGWIVAAAMGLSQQQITIDGIFSMPRLFAFGSPTFNPGVIVTCVIGAFVLLSMSFASLSSMSEVVGHEMDESKLRRMILLHGLGESLAGVMAVVPFMPFVSSTGVVKMTGVAARKPFALACLCMLAFGLLSPISVFLASMPAMVAYSANMVVFCLIFGQGLKEFGKVDIGNRESYIIGVSMICGMGVMFLPKETFLVLPDMLYFIISNGLVVGTLMAIILEQILRVKKN